MDEKLGKMLAAALDRAIAPNTAPPPPRRVVFRFMKTHDYMKAIWKLEDARGIKRSETIARLRDAHSYLAQLEAEDRKAKAAAPVVATASTTTASTKATEPAKPALRESTRIQLARLLGQPLDSSEQDLQDKIAAWETEPLRGGAKTSRSFTLALARRLVEND